MTALSTNKDSTNYWRLFLFFCRTSTNKRYRGSWKPFFLVETFCSEVFLQKWVVRKWKHLLFAANATQKAKIINQDLPKHMENIWKHKQQPGAAFGGAPKGAPPPWVGCCLCFHVFSTCLGKSWLIILAFWAAFAANKRFSPFSDHHFLQEYLSTKGFHQNKRFSQPSVAVLVANSPASHAGL